MNSFQRNLNSPPTRIDRDLSSVIESRNTENISRQSSEENVMGQLNKNSNSNPFFDTNLGKLIEEILSPKLYIIKSIQCMALFSVILYKFFFRRIKE